MSLMEELLDLVEVSEIINGYIYLSEKDTYVCLICGETKEGDVIYKSDKKGNLINARRSMEEHIEYEHGGVFNYLINLDGNFTGLTDRQKEIFEILYKYKDNQQISKLMNTTPATVRSYKYKKRERIKQSKLFLAIAYLIQRSDMEEEDVEIKIIKKAEEYNSKLTGYDQEEEIGSVEDILDKKNLDYIKRNSYD